MALNIESTDELKELLEQLDVKITNLEELQCLLDTVNKPPEPEATRVETLKTIGFGVPAVVAVAAGIVSIILLALLGKPGDSMTQFQVGALLGGLGIVWGAVAVVSVPTILVTLVFLSRLKLSSGESREGKTPASECSSPAPGAVGEEGAGQPRSLELEDRLSQAITNRTET